MRWAGLIFLVTVAGFAGVQVALARELHLVESVPASDATIVGDHAQYVIRFDGPIDHRQSRLWTTQEGKVLEQLRPSLDSEPAVLFAEGTSPPSGSYQLNWSVRSEPDGQVTNGSLAFRVSR